MSKDSLEVFDRPQPVEEADLTFGGDMEKLLPPYRELPKDFQDWTRNPYCNMAAEWFFNGLKKDLRFSSEINSVEALRHLRAVLCSWRPKHEHKIAGVGYLLHRWGVKTVTKGGTK